jgi:hypothetical protein
MAVVADFILPGLSPEDYDRIRAAVDWLDNPPERGIAHVTWWEGDDCHNVDVWEDEASMGAFIETRLGPAMAELGIQVEPQVTFHPAHEAFAPSAVRITAT